MKTPHIRGLGAEVRKIERHPLCPLTGMLNCSLAAVKASMGLSANWLGLHLKPTVERCRISVRVRVDPQ